MKSERDTRNFSRAAKMSQPGPRSAPRFGRSAVGPVSGPPGGTEAPRTGSESMDSEVFFQGWGGIARTLVVGVIAYAGLVLILRLSGKRTLSKLNAFDFVVTVAFGSTL